MRAASCSSPTSSELGLPGDRLLACVAPGAGPRFRPSLPSAFLQAGGASPSTRDSTATRISDLRKWPGSSGNCSNTCAAPWFCSGIGGRRTKGLQQKSSCAGTRVCTRTFSLAMPQNSTRMSSSGTILSEPWPTARLMIRLISSGSFIRRFKDCGNHRRCSGLASTLRTFHGHRLSITYA
jgi:hypothetical protein